jgi:hypothetical protein
MGRKNKLLQISARESPGMGRFVGRGLSYEGVFQTGCEDVSAREVVQCKGKKVKFPLCLIN